MFFSKRNSVISIIIVVWTVWLAYLGLGSAIEYLVNEWKIVLTMCFGSVIAGGTSIGGGAVAFPVFTKVLHIPPYEAKVFSLAIQSVGMGAASLTIYLTGIKVEWRVIRWGSLGGVVGIYLGLNYLAPLLPPDVIKMSFTVMLASFAITLFVLNRGVNKRHSNLFVWTFQEKSILFMAGLAGGLMSALAGTGIDIIVFSVMVLLFRISEKIATPTSVILMAINAAVGFFMQLFLFHDFAEPVSSYWIATIPVVIVGAPIGAILCSLLSRKTIVNILLFLILVEMLSSLLIISLSPLVVYSSLTTLILSCLFYYWMYRTQIYQKLGAA